MKKKKKLLLLFLALSMAVAMSAQEITRLSFSDYCSKVIGWPLPGGEAFIGGWSDDDTERRIFNSDLEEVCVIRETETTRIVNAEFYISQAGLGVYDHGSTYITQALFNKDEAYEYIVFDGETVNENSWSSFRESGFSIMNTDGKCLASVKFEDNIDPDEIEIVVLGDNLYICVETRKGGYWYKWKPEDSSLKMVRKEAASSVVARPNPVRAGASVQLDINGEYATCDVAVISIRGQLMKTVSTDDGYFSTAGLAPGQYIYKVAADGQEVGTGKLIIK